MKWGLCAAALLAPPLAHLLLCLLVGTAADVTVALCAAAWPALVLYLAAAVLQLRGAVSKLTTTAAAWEAAAQLVVVVLLLCCTVP
jgi:hypothetical protein